MPDCGRNLVFSTVSTLHGNREKHISRIAIPYPLKKQIRKASYPKVYIHDYRKTEAGQAAICLPLTKTAL